jgi:hypothetical protein
MMTRRTILQLPLAAALAPPAPVPFRMVHLDAHFARVPNPYADFDADRAAATIADAGFEMVSIFAVCNRGFSYYPTKVGTVHPGLKRDFTGEFTKALKKRKLRVLAYVSVRDCKPNLPQVSEILDQYDVDGFFFDAVMKCGDEDNTRFVDSLKPGLTYFLNHVWVTTHPVNPPKSLKTLCWEPVPPYHGSIPEDFSIQARYLPTVPGIENWTCMTTRGKGWGDRSIRDLDSYLHEAAVVLAAGGRPYWGDVSSPSGNPDPALYEIWGKVNARTAALESFVRNVQQAKEIAVRIPAAGMVGAHRFLVEEHAQFSLLNPQTLAATLPEYKALILPEPGELTPAEISAIRKFDGALLVTGNSEISRRRRTAHSTVELFGAYERDGSPEMRKAIAELLGSVFPVQNRQIEVKNTPFHVEITLNRRQNDVFVHLVNGSQATTKVEGVKVGVRTGRRPKGVREIPSRQPVRFEFHEGQVSFEALPFQIHSAYQIEG